MSLYKQSPCKPTKLGVSSQVMERSLLLNDSRRKLRNSVLWGAINICLLGIVLNEIIFTCPVRRVSYILYLEYIFAILFAFNVVYYIVRYIVISSKCEVVNEVYVSPVQHSPQNISLIPQTYQSTPTNTFTNTSSTPMNSTALSWKSITPTFNSANVSLSPPLYSYIGNSPQFVQHYSANSSPANVSFQDAMKNNSFTEEHCLAEYLKGYQVYDRSFDINESSEQATGGAGNTFWTHPAAATKDASHLMRKYQYQLSPVTPASSSSSPGSQSDDTASPMNNSTLGMEVWSQFHVDKVSLIQWNSNIRRWLSQTIVERLVNEIEHIDDLLQKHGLLDVKIGTVGIERLRKTAEMNPILLSIPTLSVLLPFLEVCSNQEYFMKRLRELAKGGCMSDFKWNGGSSFNGKEWNDSLPTDSDIIMHLFATYMDTQLLPNPNSPDLKPFTGYHYIKCIDKLPVLTSTTLLIHQFHEKPPQYRVIVGEHIFEVMKGYNNLFHTILLFLYHVNKKEHGMLGRVNLGRAGVNILWVIGS